MAPNQESNLNQNHSPFLNNCTEKHHIKWISILNYFKTILIFVQCCGKGSIGLFLVKVFLNALSLIEHGVFLLLSQEGELALPLSSPGVWLKAFVWLVTAFVLRCSRKIRQLSGCLNQLESLNTDTQNDVYTLPSYLSFQFQERSF